MADIADIDRMIARVRQLPELARRAAPEVAQVFERELRAQIARGEDPNGKAWQLTQDGRVPLRDAAKALTIRVVGDVIVAHLDGPEARHHHGRVRGGVRRQILPTREALGTVSRIVREVLTTDFRRTMGGAQ
jgi:hypothetical protein